MELSAMVEQARVLMSDRLHGAMAVHAKHDEARSTGGISASRSSHRADDYSVPSSGDKQHRHQQQQRRVIVSYKSGKERHIARYCRLNLQGTSCTQKVPQNTWF